MKSLAGLFLAWSQLYQLIFRDCPSLPPPCVAPSPATLVRSRRDPSGLPGLLRCSLSLFRILQPQQGRIHSGKISDAGLCSSLAVPG